MLVGSELGIALGLSEGDDDGVLVGCVLGIAEGADEGSTVG